MKHRFRYTIKFLHHEIVRTQAIVEAYNDVEALQKAFEKLIAEKWNQPKDFTWTGSGEFRINIEGHIIDPNEATVKTAKGKLIDVAPWMDQMKLNHTKKYNILERTPIGVTADKNYFWWDEEENLDLDKKSVQKLLRIIKSSVR